jgi:hypothetical protein
MPISFRKVPDRAKADTRAANAAAPRGPVGRQTPAIPYVKPSDMLAFRLKHRLSLKAAAALLGYQTTWWQWREAGHWLMSPEKFAEAVRAAGAPPSESATMAPRLKLTERLEVAERRIAALEARIVQLEAEKFRSAAIPGSASLL